MPEKELPLGKGRRPELAETASPMNTNRREWGGAYRLVLLGARRTDEHRSSGRWCRGE